jgi:hypothetical protein
VHWTHIWGMLNLNLGQTLAILPEVFCSITQPLMADARIVPQLGNDHHFFPYLFQFIIWKLLYHLTPCSSGVGIVIKYSIKIQFNSYLFFLGNSTAQGPITK